MSIRATFHYFQGMECDMYSFYRNPKLLFKQVNILKSLPVKQGVVRTDVRLMSLSIKNRWFDEEDRAYIFFEVEFQMKAGMDILKELEEFYIRWTESGKNTVKSVLEMIS